MQDFGGWRRRFRYFRSLGGPGSISVTRPSRSGVWRLAREARDGMPQLSRWNGCGLRDSEITDAWTQRGGEAHG